MNMAKIEIKNISELFKRDTYLKPFENEIKRRYVLFC